MSYPPPNLLHSLSVRWFSPGDVGPLALVSGEPSAAKDPGPAPDLGPGLEASFKDLSIVN